MSGSARVFDDAFYAAQVPDTLDLAERAGLAIHAMTQSVRRTADSGYLSIWWGGAINRNPPVLFRPYGYLYGKFAESLPLLRLVSGSQENLYVDAAWRQELARLLREATLPSGETIPGGPLGVDGGRYLVAASVHFAIEGDPEWQDLARDYVARIRGFVDKGEYGYFAPPPTGWGATFLGWGVQGLTQVFRSTGDPLAGHYAKKLAYYLKDHAQVLGPEGQFLARHDSPKGPALHFHHNANALESLSEYALAFDDRPMGEFARKGYLWARARGSPLVGFFPEYLDDWPDDRGVVDCEACCTADMIQLALNLTRAGLADYWDDVDRYVRNQFAEMQITDTGRLASLAARSPTVPVGQDEDAEGMPDRLLGDFAGWSGANDFYIGVGPGIQHCCLGNCSRALYAVWANILDWHAGSLRVNLLLNRASAWADLNSYIPYEGRAEIRLKQDCTLLIRIPEWATASEVRCAVNEVRRALEWEGRYAVVGPVGRGDVVRLEFPLSERTVTETIGGLTYTLTLRGNEVVEIQPPGRNYPYYQRQPYRSGQARWRVATRFVPKNAWP